MASRRVKAVSRYLVCIRDNSWDGALKRTKICFCFLLFLFTASDAPPHGQDPPSAPPPFSLSSPLCPPFFYFVLSLLSLLPPSLSPPSLPPCTLWYADMQEFLGLKMIDQTCQPWLLLLKMAAWQCVCRRLVRIWVTPRVIGCNVFVHSSCVVGRSRLRALGDWKPFFCFLSGSCVI